MGELRGRVAVVTGAGRGLGREHALLLAAEGARVVVNDRGGAADGDGTDPGPAQQVVAEIRAAGGEATANGDDVADWVGAQRLVETAVDTFGGLDILVNNAGILRDRTLANMSEAEWDDVLTVHLKGHFAPTRWAMAYWRDQAKQGHELRPCVVNTTSIAGLLGNHGQTNYGAAKAGIAAFTLIAAMEGARYGVRANAIAPLARTRLTHATPGLSELAGDGDGFRPPGDVSPLVAYLASASCPVTGGVFHIGGSEVGLFQGWELTATAETTGRWTVSELARVVPTLCGDRLELPSVRPGSGSFVDVLTRAVRR